MSSLSQVRRQQVEAVCKDHRFEWTRTQFQSWATGVANRFGYSARFLPVGPEDAEVGPATQMAVFALDFTHQHV